MTDRQTDRHTHKVRLLWTRDRPKSWYYFLGAFAKLRLLGSSCECLSVCPSIRMEQLGLYWTDFYAIWYLRILRKSIEKDEFSLKCDKNNRYFMWVLGKFIIIYHSNLLRMRNVLDKSCGENQNTHYIFNN